MSSILHSPTLKQAIVGLGLMALLVCILLALPGVFLPKRWLDVRPGQERTAIHAVLGVPDADFSGTKDFDGWHNSFGIGASVLTVRYDETGAKVSSVSIKTEWGVDHLNWVQEYKSRLTAKTQ